MFRRILRFASRPRVVQRVVFAGVNAILLAAPLCASAQLARVGGVVASLTPGGTMRGTDTAYDPVHDVYLLVVGNGPIYGVFVNNQGSPVTPPFLIMSAPGVWAHFPRAAYSQDILGGQGGFLVTWHHNVDPLGSVNCVFGRIVSFVQPGALVTPVQQYSDTTQLGSWHETGPAMAYSKTSHRFLVGWRTKQYGIQGRFVDANGAAISGVLPLENPGGSRDPAVAWNAATDEFGLVYTGFGGSGAFAAFRRVRASDGFVSPRTTFGFSAGTFATAIDVNTSNNQYVLAWAVHPGTWTATFDQNGNQLATNFVTGRLGFDQSLGMAYNAASGTFLAVSSDLVSFEVAAVEVASGGNPNSTAQIITDGARLGSFYPLTASRPGTSQWDVVYARDFQGAMSQIIATASTGGGSPAISAPTFAPTLAPASTSGCTTPDPFAAIGGGTCVNGGWVPKAPAPASAPAPAPAPAPTTTTSACTTPDPFAAIGGGVCVNGGWVPAGAAPKPAPTPTPAPTASTCTTADPFATIGGGVCVNGGWVPAGAAPAPVATPASAPSATPSTCTTPDPFVSIGGGTCINGGWVPRS